MRRILTLSIGLLLPVAPLAAKTDNGNDLALSYTSAGAAEQRELAADSTGKLFFFRYLRIVEIEKSDAGGGRQIRMSTVEPSSDMVVNFVVTKKVSLSKAEPLAQGEAIAVTGRLRGIGQPANTIELDPVIVRYKDRLSPKMSKELLYEVDPDARRGTDTSTGEEKVLK